MLLGFKRPIEVIVRAIIIGATSGIGRELAKQMSMEGFTVGITGRRGELLDSLEQELVGKCFKCVMDLVNVVDAVSALEQLLAQMERVDVIVINSGVGFINADFLLTEELVTVAVNVAGFTAMANVAAHYFLKLGCGHIVGISSVAAHRGGRACAYNASKAYITNYLEGLACRFYSQKSCILVSDIRPGFVATAMAKSSGIFWMASAQKAAKQIMKAIRSRRRVVYITKRWRLVALVLSCLPFWLYRKFLG